MTNIIMHGCNGKMGQVISSIVEKDSNTQMVAGIDLSSNGKNSYPVFSSLAECSLHADVVIDFSTASAVIPLLTDAIEKKLPVVLCTTGLNQKELDFVKFASQSIPVLFSANMSLGVNLLISLAQKAAEILSPSNFDIEIIEKHHNLKIDAPSGTALAIADGINETLNNSLYYKYDRSQERVPRDKKELGIHAVRGGTIVGEHSVIFAGQDEILELKHSALSKEIFAVGSVNAAKFLANKTPGLYNMGDLIG